MDVVHATTRERYEAIRTEGLRVACADPAATIKGIWMVSQGKAPYGVLHTQRKHGAPLEEVVVLTIHITPKMRRSLRKFKNVTTGYTAWYSVVDIPASAIVAVQPGAIYGQSIAK